MNRQTGPYKSRDPEITKQLLVDTVGEILTEQGFQGLGVNKVGYRAGVNKKLIYWYFDSYNNLLKKYIWGRDFWKPVFDKFRLRKQPKAEEMGGYISDIFQEQFKCFFGNQELQNMILWQISEANPLLREISEEREKQAEPIANLTDPHFEGSDINFRAVLALVLGGIYYVVCHAKNNRSKVCGIDINNERDRVAFEKAIRQVIEAVWEKAGKPKS
ncbi:TetR/AcrR family transcriptional regulator [Pedobacter sp. UC225_61]|uniref:TetR/AcrR family transcriptional regulator n=1 Tax=Pedobacter sp. UC225_61 TaxID=3374623 RepID=UPI0037A059FC